MNGGTTNQKTCLSHAITNALKKALTKALIKTLMKAAVEITRTRSMAELAYWTWTF